MILRQTTPCKNWKKVIGCQNWRTSIKQSNIKIRIRSVLFKCFTDCKIYNKKNSHLAYQLRNVFGTKASLSCDVYSLGYIFKYLLIKKIVSNFNFKNDGWITFPSGWYYICSDYFKGSCKQMCAYCLILMNFLDFKREFKNFTDFKIARISKILFAIMSWNKSCFQVFSIMCFLLVSPFCDKKISFASNQKHLSWWILLKFILTIASLGKHAKYSRVNVLCKLCK